MPSPTPDRNKKDPFKDFTGLPVDIDDPAYSTGIKREYHRFKRTGRLFSSFCLNAELCLDESRRLTWESNYKEEPLTVDQAQEVMAAIEPLKKAVKSFGEMWERELREALRWKNETSSPTDFKKSKNKNANLAPDENNLPKVLRLIGEGQGFVIGIHHTSLNCNISIQGSFGEKPTDSIILSDQMLSPLPLEYTPDYGEVGLIGCDCDPKQGAELIRKATKNFPKLKHCSEEDYQKLFKTMTDELF